MERDEKRVEFLKALRNGDTERAEKISKKLAASLKSANNNKSDKK